MGSGTVPTDPLVKATELSRYNVPSSFLAQFDPRPFAVLISTAGALGVMAFQWQWIGDTSWSEPIVSDAGASFLYTLDDTFCDLTFATASYALNAEYTIDRNGVVTGGAGEVTAARFDLRVNACSAATYEAMQLMRDAIRPPLTRWGDDATTHAAAIAYAILKRGRGSTPPGADGSGDTNVYSAEGRALEFFRDIGKNGKPDSMVDTSTTIDGPLIPVYPKSPTQRRGW